ncbi:virulence RhuM family protein [Tessaracoccus sp. Y1736]
MSEPAGEVILYNRDDGSTALEVRLQNDTVWLTQQQLADLFGTTRQNIGLHLSNIYDEGELDRAATSKDFLLVRDEGSRQVRRSVEHFNLDAIISVGYRVKSGPATRFRIWATERLREYLVKGFVMNDEALKELGGGRYWRELLGRIRDIRSSEKVLYRQLLDLYATSVDYDPQAAETSQFFAVVQNKLHFAAHGHTAAEVIADRADATQPNMGMTSFSGQRVRKSDIAVAKNYLTEPELKRLNTLVSAYFDAAEFRAQSHEPTYMKDWLQHLDRLIVAMGAESLPGAGSVSHAAAVGRASGEYEKYRARLDEVPSDVEETYLAALKRARRELDGRAE